MLLSKEEVGPLSTSIDVLPLTFNVTSAITLQLKNGGKIHISEDGDITFDGFKDFKFKCDGDMDFEAENINMHAKSMITNIDGPIYTGSSDYIIQQGKRVHLNPFGLGENTGYFGNIKNKVLDYFKFIREK